MFADNRGANGSRTHTAPSAVPILSFTVLNPPIGPKADKPPRPDFGARFSDR
jgi:hypothetical protein